MAGDDDFYYGGFRSPNFTPVPDDLFDMIAPRLSEAELRVLLYIIRRTFGFKKDADSISLKQLVEGIKTKEGIVLDSGSGVSRPSATRAVKGLEAKGLISVTRNRSAEKGDQPTTYTLKFETPPVVHSLTRGGIISYDPRVAPLNPQETVEQETEEQETDFEIRNSKGPAPKSEEKFREAFAGTQFERRREGAN